MVTFILRLAKLFADKLSQCHLLHLELYHLQSIFSQDLPGLYAHFTD